MTPAVVMLVGPSKDLVEAVRAHLDFYGDAIMVEWDPQKTPGVTTVELDSLGEVRVDNAVIQVFDTYEATK